MNRTKRVGKRVLSVLLVTALMMVYTTNLAGVSSVFAETYEFNTTDIRAVLSAVLKSEIPQTPMNGQEDRDKNGKYDTKDVRIMLSEILAGTNYVVTSQPVAENAIRLSSISDVTDASGQRSYDIYAPYTDTYSLSCTTASSISIYSGDNLIKSGTTSLNVALEENVGYTLKITSRYTNSSFNLTVSADNHKVTLPYDLAEPISTGSFNLYNNSAYMVASKTVDYQKREGGTYIYCNNPEIIQSDAVGDALMRNENLTGEVFMTYEHSSYTSTSFYLGYQVKNTGDSDVFITVTNVGYQTSGSWYGQYAWYDFYNTSFTLPDPSTYNNADYLFYDYTPRVFQPITYRLPAGKYMYVVGGTTSDAYRNINVDGTANKKISRGNCVNAAVKFIVTGGSVTGTMYCYSRTSQVAANPAQTGYRVDNNYKGHSYGLQYQGSADHAGVIDCYLDWTFNDEIGSGMLPVSYTSYHASKDNVASMKTPYGAYNNTNNTYSRVYQWQTHINPQDVNTAVGSDMVSFKCVDSNGVQRVVDVEHADGTGNFGNFGNWMIEYQEHITLVNQGNKDRKLNFHFDDNGAMLMMARDTETGEIIQADFPVGGQTTGVNYVYTVTVPAHSVKQFTLAYLLMPMSAGTVNHFVSIV